MTYMNDENCLKIKEKTIKLLTKTKLNTEVFEVDQKSRNIKLYLHFKW